MEGGSEWVDESACDESSRARQREKETDREGERERDRKDAEKPHPRVAP